MESKEMLSDRQYAILQFIYQYKTDHGFVPSIREICRAVEISSTSVVNYNMERLTAQGYLLRTPGKARAFALTGHARELFEEHYVTDVGELREEIRLLRCENERLRRDHKSQNATLECEYELALRNRMHGPILLSYTQCDDITGRS
jgi:SOS-response transcriptional repressor LexA